MSQININNLTFSYEGSYDNIFTDVTFLIDTDWKLGFVGRNGRGKTTFFMLLLGNYEYSGSIKTSVSFEYFPYTVSNKKKKTIDIVYDINNDCQEWELLRELAFLKVNPAVLDRNFETLSKGEQNKILLAVLFLKENSFLLIDEPTNHLDLKGRKIVSEYLQKKSGFILISHDRAFLDKCVDHILSINKTNIEIQKGNFTSWWENKQQKDHFEITENEKLKKNIKRLEIAARQTSDWSDKVEKDKIGTRNSGLRPDTGYIGHKAAKMMKRSKSIENRQQLAIDEKSKLLKNIEQVDELKIFPLKYHHDTLVRLENISIIYDERRICGNISFNIQRGDKIALSGENGSGKSSIIKLILGEFVPYQGNMQKSSNLKISYVSQDTSGVIGSLKDYAMRYGIDENLFMAILRKLDFSKVQFEKDISDFSDGQKKKVLIARSLCEQAHLYIWDEPLNYIDVLSRLQIEELLKEYDITILFVEHDSAFCSSIATKTVFVNNNINSINN